ncbi:MAG: VanZ family protein [Salinivirgaceae bacterium]|nr:VanZ family protein [Salinivirgaceae bacterium]
MKLVFTGISVMWLGVVMALSLMSISYNEVSLFSNSDKAVHFIMYGILTIFVLSRMQLEEHVSQQVVILVSVSLVIVLGGVLEIAQGLFTVSRQASFWDFTANGLGAVVAAMVHKKWLWNAIGRNFMVSIAK